MKLIWREVILSVAMAMLLPGILVYWPREETVPEETTVPLEEPTRGPVSVRLTMRLRHTDGTVEDMDMDEYLTGVVLAEIPSTFAPEAKKAQAVAARTFAWKAWVTGGKHGDGSVCDQSGCCQAYLTRERYLEKGGSEQAVEAAWEAVCATSGYVLTYEGKPIEATYFSCSGGSTEDAVAVWGADFPYLRAVESPGEEAAAHHRDMLAFSRWELEKKLGVTLTGQWLGKITYTAGGGVDTICIGGKTFTGKEIRTLLNLRSTAFSIKTEGEEIVIITKGYGHRVGMSQYGADAMARGGSSFAEILAYYYPGTSLELTNSDG